MLLDAEAHGPSYLALGPERLGEPVGATGVHARIRPVRQILRDPDDNRDWVVDATDDEFHAVVDESSLPVLVDVWAPWCGPCRMVSPALEKLAGELAGRLKLVKVNADANPEVSRRFEVRSIPTLVILDHGQVVDKQIGARPEPQLRSWLASKLPRKA